jgi:hypothetical protein
MSETLRERLDNLELFLKELTDPTYLYNSVAIVDQANYHLATMDCLNKMLEGRE